MDDKRAGFDSQSGRAASLKSPWRNAPACPTEKARTLRVALDDGWYSGDPATEQVLGISMRPWRPFGQMRDFLVSAGWRAEQIQQILHPNDAMAIRQRGGLVVHIERSARPHFAQSISSAGLDVEIGDFVLTDADNPGEYLPRLLAALSRLAAMGGV